MWRASMWSNSMEWKKMISICTISVSIVMEAICSIIRTSNPIKCSPCRWLLKYYRMWSEEQGFCIVSGTFIEISSPKVFYSRRTLKTKNMYVSSKKDIQTGELHLLQESEWRREGCCRNTILHVPRNFTPLGLQFRSRRMGLRGSVLFYVKYGVPFQYLSIYLATNTHKSIHQRRDELI